jgi:two-component system response regulator
MADKQILLVEDKPDLKLLTCSAIEAAAPGCEVIWAREGRQALDYLWARADFACRDPGEQPALVILDMHLPDLPGLQVLQLLRGHRSTAVLPVVMLTSSRLPQDVLACYQSGANGYVSKPVSFAQYRRKIGGLVDFWLEVNETAACS